MRKRLIGLPGTGKTTRLLQILENLLRSYEPGEIIYASFSTAAVKEAKERVLLKFNDIQENELQYFRTIHSLCLRMIKQEKILKAKQPVSRTDYSQFLHQFGKDNTAFRELLDDLRIKVSTTTWYHPEVKQDNLSEYTLGTHPERFFQEIFSYMQANYGCTPLSGKKFISHAKDLRNRIGLTLKYYKPLINQLVLLELKWNEYKKENGLFEFHELLSTVIKQGLIPQASVLIVDEFQDSSHLQSKIVELWSSEMNLTIVAGDPNQAIYGFNGASPHYLEDFEHDETVLLDKTWRMPQSVVNYAKMVLDNHWTKTMIAATEKSGKVFRSSLDNIAYQDYKKIYILARNNSLLQQAKQEIADAGSLYIDDELKIVPVIYSLYHSIEFEEQINANVLSEILKLGGVKTYDLFDSSARKFIIELMKNGKSDISLEYDLLVTLMGTDNKKLLNSKLLNILELNQIQFYSNLKQKALHPSNMITDLKRIEFMTMHASKGKEADLVVIIDAASWYEEQGLINEDEERRLHFVAVTRSRQDVAIVSLKDQYSKTQFLPEIKEDIDIEAI